MWCEKSSVFYPYLNFEYGNFELFLLPESSHHLKAVPTVCCVIWLVWSVDTRSWFHTVLEIAPVAGLTSLNVTLFVKWRNGLVTVVISYRDLEKDTYLLLTWQHLERWEQFVQKLATCFGIYFIRMFIGTRFWILTKPVEFYVMLTLFSHNIKLLPAIYYCLQVDKP